MKIIKLFRVFVLIAVGLSMAGVASAAPKPKHHAAPAALSLVATPIEHPVKTAKLTLTGILRVVGIAARGTEGVVDVIHYGTTGLSKGASLELKHNPFVYPDKVAAFADTKLEQGYFFFWHVQI